MSTCSVQLGKLRMAFLAAAFAIAAVFSMAIAQPAHAVDSTDVWDRLAGQTALDTMQSIVEEGWDGQEGGSVVLTTFDGYWDALAASGIAGRVEAPVLMSQTSGLSAQTADLIAKLKPAQLIVCGGPEALPDSIIEQAVKASGGSIEKSTRLSGDTARGTAVSIYKDTADFDGEWSTTAFVATSFSYHDALAAAPIAYAKHMPVFMTRSYGFDDNGVLDDAIEDETLAAMKDGGVTDVIICGGPAAVSEGVEAKLVESFGEDHVSRLFGATAVETSQALAEYGIGELGMQANGMGVATVNDYYDALAGAALCGLGNSVITLVGDPANSVITDFIPAEYRNIDKGYVFGGPAAVSEPIYDALKAIDCADYFGLNLYKGTEMSSKSLTKNEFKNLKSDSDAPQSATFNTNYVSTAATYITLEDLFSYAGEDYASIWKDGKGAVSYAASDGFSGSAEIATLKGGNFYPDGTAASKVAVIPSIALTEYSTQFGTDEAATAADAQKINVERADAKNTPRIVYGVTEDQFADGQTPMGRNFVSNIVSVTLKDEAASQLATVTFMTNGGTEIATQLVEKGSMVDASKVQTTKEGCFFDGWYQKSSFKGDPIDLSTYTFDADTTLYAKWAEGVVVTFDSQGGSAVESQTVEPGGHATMPANPTKGDETFSGWYDNPECTGYDVNFSKTTFTENTTLYAKWRSDFFTVNLEKDGKIVETKAYSKSQFEALKSDSGAFQSRLYTHGPDGWTVITATEYVTLADIFADAGFSESWKAGAKLAVVDNQNKQYSYEEVTGGYFFPAADSAMTGSTEGMVKVEPALAIKQATTNIDGVQYITGKDAQDNNAKIADDQAEPRILWGITELAYTSKGEESFGAAGNSSWRNVSAITLIAPSTATTAGLQAA